MSCLAKVNAVILQTDWGRVLTLQVCFVLKSSLETWPSSPPSHHPLSPVLLILDLCPPLSSTHVAAGGAGACGTHWWSPTPAAGLFGFCAPSFLTSVQKTCSSLFSFTL